MTSTLPSDARQQPASEPSSDEGHAVTLTTILQRVQSRQKAVEDAQDADAQEGYRSPPFARSSLSKSVGKPSLAPSSKPFSRVCYTKTPHNRVADYALSSSDNSQTRRQRCYTNAPHNRLPGIVLRDRLYYVRRRVPDALRPVIGGAEIWRSLRTDSLREAVRRLHVVAAEIEACFESARSFVASSPEAISPSVAGARAIISIKQNDSLLKEFGSEARVMTLGDAYRLYLTDPRHSRGHRTTEAYLTTQRWVEEFFGADIPITSITRERCREFVSFLLNVPKHAHKRFPGLSLDQIVELTKGDLAVERINAAHVNGYLNKFAGAMNWAEQEGLILRNPAKGLRIPDPVRKRDKRRPFSTAQLQRIFSAPIFTGCEDDEQGYARSGPNQPKRARFWIPLIALTSGMRLNEICQLDTADVLLCDDVPCFNVREGIGGEKDAKRVKTAASERIIPLHRLLREAGFLNYVDARRAARDAKLFPELRAGSTGYRSKPFSQWFARFLIGRDATAPLTCFHSFRHCFRDALRSSGVSRELSLALGGWTQPGAKSEIADIYGTGFPPRMLEAAMDKIEFAELDFSHLLPAQGSTAVIRNEL